MSEYGNISSNYYLYGSYIVTAITLSAFIVQSILRRHRAIKQLSDEGFLEKET